MAEQPWYRRVLRWGQTNITELDPTRYDIDWWRKQWRRTRVQGIIINAGGIVAYYPSRFPLQHRAEFLGERDLFGEIAAAARDEGLAVVARMDSNRTFEPFYDAHPNWFARKQNGEPFTTGPFYLTCVSSPYYETYLPEVLREIIERYAPDGFADNSWSGLHRDQICYCHNCRRAFGEETGRDLPAAVNWDDPAYRAWIKWSYRRRLEIWDLNNRVTREAGGPDCLWIGMNSGDVLGQSRSFRDYKAICERSELVFLDNQTRRAETGFQANGDMGKLIHGLLGWDKLVPESMAMYQSPSPTFRVASRPVAEARMWMVEGLAGTIQPWWHHIGAYHEDRRQYFTAPPVLRWHARNEAYMVHRRPIATVGVVWSQENLDFFGREAPEARVMTPYWGVVQALIRARIPYVPVHADHIVRDGDTLSALVLPNVGALSNAQCAAIRRFVGSGGGLIASGEASRYDLDGDPRPDYALADLFGVHARGTHRGALALSAPNWDAYALHSYLRLKPELRASVDGPTTGDEPVPSGSRSPVLAGFEETDLMPFGGRLEDVDVVARDAVVPLTYVEPFPIYPPETAWMREPDSGDPGLVLREVAGMGRVAYLPASLDHAFGKTNLPDHGHLLANLVRWVARDRIPLNVVGPGLLDCHLYRQDGRLVLHLVNLSHPGTWRPPLHDLISVGPFEVAVKLPPDVAGERVECLVREQAVTATVEDGWVRFDVPWITDHEVVVVT
ncbi:MAG: beta-galactosidase [Anaerolineae bacterium]|nr:beta-galactosidase [Anaerolineae bacterium]